MTAVCTIFAKEADKFTPFLKFGNAVKDPKLAFAFTVLWKNNINSTVRRIYSGHSDYFSTGLIFERKRKEFFFLANKNRVTQLLRLLCTNPKKWRSFLNNPHPHRFINYIRT